MATLNHPMKRQIRLQSLVIPACLICAMSPLLAAPAKITVHGGDHDATDSIVTFDAPKDWAREYTVVGKGGKVVSKLQVNEDGKATMIIDHIGKGETVTFTPAPHTPPTRPYGVVAEKVGGVLRLTSHHTGKAQTIFDYQMEPGDVPEGVLPIFKHGAHLHPVYSPGGKLITGNHPEDHRWHRGIWMAWTKTEFEGQHPDFWNVGKGDGKEKSGGNLLAEVRFHSLVRSWSGPVCGGFVSKHRFIDHNSGAAKDVLNETWEVTAYPVTRGERPMFIIDFVSTQTCAGASALNLPKYHYGGLGVRGNAAWNPVAAVTMLTSNGDDRAKGDATKGRWVHIGGEVDGAPTGMALLIHPENFRFPQPLRLNPKNPQLCIAPSQDGDWSIEPGKPLVSKYRFIVCDGKADAAMIESAWLSYAQTLKVTLE